MRAANTLEDKTSARTKPRCVQLASSQYTYVRLERVVAVQIVSGSISSSSDPARTSAKPLYTNCSTRVEHQRCTVVVLASGPARVAFDSLPPSSSIATWLKAARTKLLDSLAFCLGHVRKLACAHVCVCVLEMNLIAN